MVKCVWCAAVLSLCSGLVAQTYPKIADERAFNDSLELGNLAKPSTLLQTITVPGATTISAIVQRPKFLTSPATSASVSVVVKIDMGEGCLPCNKHYGIPSAAPHYTTMLSGQASIAMATSTATMGEGATVPEPWAFRYLLNVPFVVSGPSSVSVWMDWPSGSGQSYRVDCEVVDQNNWMDGPTTLGATQGIAGTGCGSFVAPPRIAWSPRTGYYLDQTTVGVASVWVDLMSLSTTSTRWGVGLCSSALDPLSTVVIPFARSTRIPFVPLLGTYYTQRFAMGQGGIAWSSPSARSVLPERWTLATMPEACASHSSWNLSFPWAFVATRFE